MVRSIVAAECNPKVGRRVVMGRTLPTTTEILKREIEEWKPFRDMLPKSERKQFDEMLRGAHVLNYATMTALPSHPIAIQPIFLSIIFRHYIQLHEMMYELDIANE